MTSENVITPSIPDLTPREIMAKLDRYIIGQHHAKKAVAIALRNRMRRRLVADELKDEILPKNILMIGATGVGKTEIARRLAHLANAPFLKVEASKFTEVGYVGRDAESMVRDLVDIAVNMVKQEHSVLVEAQARLAVEEHLLDLYHPPLQPAANLDETEAQKLRERHQRNREKLRQSYREGALDDMVVEVELEQRSTPFLNVFSNNGSLEELNQQFSDLLPTFFGGGKKKKSMTIGEAREKLKQDKEQGLIDMDKVHQVALERASQSGIIFLDEIDKIADSYDHQGPNVSREGVQRDLLPIIEGSTVNTKYGMIKTDHILFIAAGAFHISKPSDLMPELQGRFPIQVRLDNLTEQDFLRILTEPKNSLVKQIKALMATEDVHVTFDESGLRAIAAKAFDANEQTDNIGARRLHTITEQVIEDISFDADRLGGTSVLIDEAYVAERLSKRASRDALKDYIL